jgi:hypothetical protein
MCLKTDWFGKYVKVIFMFKLVNLLLFLLSGLEKINEMINSVFNFLGKECFANIKFININVNIKY